MDSRRLIARCHPGDVVEFLFQSVLWLGIAIVAVFVEWRITVYGATPEGIDAAYSEAFILLTVTFLLATVAALRMKPRE